MFVIPIVHLGCHCVRCSVTEYLLTDALSAMVTCLANNAREQTTNLGQGGTGNRVFDDRLNPELNGLCRLILAREVLAGVPLIPRSVVYRGLTLSHHKVPAYQRLRQFQLADNRVLFILIARPSGIM